MPTFDLTMGKGGSHVILCLQPVRSNAANHRKITLIIILAALMAVGCSRQPTAPESDLETYDYTELPSILKAIVPENGPNPTPLSLQMANSGTCDLDYNIFWVTVDGTDWLEVSPTSGILQYGVSSVPKSSTILTVMSESASIAVDQTRIEVDTTPPLAWVSTSPGPTARMGHTAVWSGRQMIVWGGSSSGLTSDALSTGGKMWGLSGEWTNALLRESPSLRMYHSAVWTGSRMIVFGGLGFDGSPLAIGGLYEPDAYTWLTMDSFGAPTLLNQVVVWTGSEILIWGGMEDGGVTTDTGEVFE